MRGGPSLKGKGGLVGFRKNPQSETGIHGSESEFSRSETENHVSEPENPGSERGEHRIRSHESQFIFVLNEAGVSSNGDSLFLHHPPPMGVVAPRLAVPQVGHHVAHVAGREGIRACCYGHLGLSAARKQFVSMRSHTAKCSSAAGETSDGPPTIE